MHLLAQRCQSQGASIASRDIEIRGSFTREHETRVLVCRSTVQSSASGACQLQRQYSRPVSIAEIISAGGDMHPGTTSMQPQVCETR